MDSSPAAPDGPEAPPIEIEIEIAERVRIDVAMLCELFDRGVEVDGDTALADGPRWVIYGRTTYDGELILAEYDGPEQAEAVMHLLPLRARDGR